MNEERLQERLLALLSAAADGDLTRAERDELDGLLSASPEAARVQAEMSQLETILAEIPDVEPPSGLHESIMNSVTLPAPKASGSIAEWFATIGLAPVVRHAFSMAVGVMLAVTVYESQPKFAFSTDITELVGTIAPDSGKTNRKIIDSFSVSAIGVSSVARLEQLDDTFVLDVRFDTNKAVDIAIDFSGTDLEIEALAQTLSSLDSIDYANQVLRVSGQGQRRFAVLMRSGVDAPLTRETKIRLEYSSDGAILQQGALSSAR